jgi:CheY-like chemotaxis protein
MSMRVLYVDDDRVNSVLFEEACRLHGGLEVKTAESGAEALDLVQRWSPDLLLIDLHLPDTRGYELLPALRAQLCDPDLPAILCTADEPAAHEQPARAAGFKACWAKPVSPQCIVSLPRRDGAAGPR